MKDSIIGVEKIKINIKYLFQNILCPMILNVFMNDMAERSNKCDEYN